MNFNVKLQINVNKLNPKCTEMIINYALRMQSNLTLKINLYKFVINNLTENKNYV